MSTNQPPLSSSFLPRSFHLSLVASCPGTPPPPPPSRYSSKSKSSLFHPPRGVMKTFTPGRPVGWGWGVFYLQFFIKGIIPASSKHKNKSVIFLYGEDCMTYRGEIVGDRSHHFGGVFGFGDARAYGAAVARRMMSAVDTYFHGHSSLVRVSVRFAAPM